MAKRSISAAITVVSLRRFRGKHHFCLNATAGLPRNTSAVMTTQQTERHHSKVELTDVTETTEAFFFFCFTFVNNLQRFWLQTRHEDDLNYVVFWSCFDANLCCFIPPMSFRTVLPLIYLWALRNIHVWDLHTNYSPLSRNTVLITLVNTHSAVNNFLIAFLHHHFCLFFCFFNEANLHNE